MKENNKEDRRICGKKMHLPKVVRQMGRITGENRVYIEDYVYTYLNEMKKENRGFPVRAALYGHAFCREGQNFYLIYGASCVMEELENGRDQDEIQKLFFDSYRLIGYVNIYDRQEIADEKDGCYIFYESNEAMQSYMLSCYERKSKRDAGEKKAETKSNAGFWKRLIQNILLGCAALIAAVAVASICDYADLCGFTLAAARVLQETE